MLTALSSFVRDKRPNIFHTAHCNHEPFAIYIEMPISFSEYEKLCPFGAQSNLISFCGTEGFPSSVYDSSGLDHNYKRYK